MAGKNADGFTKSAQKKKFIRNRDIKLKDSELKKEAKIVKGMCEGVCPKCREKVQWRFKYDKYKPLKHPATCQACKNKTVNKAYRTLCDPCATSKNICSSCCSVLVETENENENSAMAVEEEKQVIDVTSTSQETIQLTKKNDKKKEIMKETNDDDDEEEENDDDDEIDNDDNNNNDNINDTTSIQTESNHNNNNLMDTVWDERKFNNMANKKYSKTRTIGIEDEYQKY